jgi:galactokinase
MTRVHGDVKARAEQLATRFRSRFGDDPAVFRAPGRVNLIGEHTDYNNGFVLPAAVGLSCYVAAAPRDDSRVVIASEEMRQEATWNLDDPQPGPDSAWSRYVIGVAALLRMRTERATGVTLLIDSEVPMGAGLSSSAALEVSAALALRELWDITIAPTELAQLCQQAEIEFAGARVGVMDQFVACHGRAGQAVLLDCRSLEHQLVAIPEGVRLVACNTMVRHAHAAGEYNRRRTECEAGVAQIATRLAKAQSLRDVNLGDLEACRGDLPDTVFRRCRHVVSENDRVVKTVLALEEGDLEAVGNLMAASHKSLRTDYQVSCSELDAMVDIAGEATGVIGARMTGGGFGGCTVNLVDADHVEAFRAHMMAIYAARIGHRPDVYVTDAADGASRVI